METLQNIRPRLIEPGVKYFLSSSLEQWLRLAIDLCFTFFVILHL